MRLSPRPQQLNCPRHARGFTLIEIVAAFAILALGLGIAMQAASGAMQQSRQASEYSLAALHAQSLLDTVGVAERLQVGDSEGEFDDGYRWRLSVSEYTPEASELPEGFDPAGAPVRLLQLDLVIAWDRGEREATAAFSTLRALLPEGPG